MHTPKSATSQCRLANQEIHLAAIYRKLSRPDNGSLPFCRSMVSPDCIKIKGQKDDQTANGSDKSFL